MWDQKGGQQDGCTGEIVHGDITDFDAVDRTIEEAGAVIHVAVYAGIYVDSDINPSSST